MCRLGIQMIAVLLLVVFAGCATTGSSSVGSDAWYQQRIAEIDASHENGDINKEEYLRLKGETDGIYAESQRNRRYSRPRVSFSFGFFAH